MMPSVELEDNEWQRVMAIIAMAPWRDANPLLMKIGAQLQGKISVEPSINPLAAKSDGGKEVNHG
jgi:hypothetical protein